MPPPQTLSQVYCTDEEIAAEATGDYPLLVPAWQIYAAGSDGVFSNTNPFVLTSPSNIFDTQGCANGMVMQITGPKTNFKGSGEIYAVDSVLGNTVTIRRLYQPLSTGYPPGGGNGINSVVFSVMSLYPQIDESAYEINSRYMLDINVGGRSPSNIYDLRMLRRANVLMVLKKQYMAEVRVQTGDWKMKLMSYTEELDLVLDRIMIRWGTSGTDMYATNKFSQRIVR